MTRTVTMEEREKFFLARRRAGVKQDEIAHAVSVSQAAVCRWEKGRLRLPGTRVQQFWDALAQLEREE